MPRKNVAKPKPLSDSHRFRTALRAAEFATSWRYVLDSIFAIGLGDKSPHGDFYENDNRFESGLLYQLIRDEGLRVEGPEEIGVSMIEHLTTAGLDINIRRPDTAVHTLCYYYGNQECGYEIRRYLTSIHENGIADLRLAFISFLVENGADYSIRGLYESGENSLDCLREHRCHSQASKYYLLNMKAVLKGELKVPFPERKPNLQSQK